MYELLIFVLGGYMRRARHINEGQRYTRTDLACEWGRAANSEQKGVLQQSVQLSFGVQDTLQIMDEHAARQLGRPCGIYITLRCSPMWKLEQEQSVALEKRIASLLSDLLAEQTGKQSIENTAVMVVGLGNREITADAIGPTVVDGLLVTRHLRDHEPALFERMACSAVSALAPGVLGQTGMEVAEVVAGAVRRCRPDAIIAIDALAARSCERLAATVQLTNAGISPGSGIGNDRCALTRESMGVPVIALGVPTVVDSSTLVYDALHQAGIDHVDERLREILENGRRFYVSPKEADVITRRTAQVLARAVNRALVGVPSVS
jgi:spore protease